VTASTRVDVGDPDVRDTHDELVLRIQGKKIDLQIRTDVQLPEGVGTEEDHRENCSGEHDFSLLTFCRVLDDHMTSDDRTLSRANTC
jgi:hypothetical protein